jgi:hypothetical protein
MATVRGLPDGPLRQRNHKKPQKSKQTTKFQDFCQALLFCTPQHPFILFNLEEQKLWRILSIQS